MKEKRLKHSNQKHTKESSKRLRRLVIMAASATAATVILMSTADRFQSVFGRESVIPENKVQAEKESQMKKSQAEDSKAEDLKANEPQADNSQSGVSQADAPRSSESQTEEPRAEDLQVKEPQIKVEVDLEAEENEQKSVDAGHSPWKLDPIFVSQVFASLLLSPDGIVGDYPIAYEDITIIENNGTDAIAEIKDDKSIAKYVYLKRLVRQDDTGIWSVTGYDTSK